jgi:2-polyprenyl-3-methyl-5-hydroxy-6-metoxy-1,4-benzoquinol methylase
MKKSESFWDKVANTYDKVEKKDEKIYINIIERTKKHLKISDTVLDYGCGTGLISNEIADDVKVIHAIDISSNMIGIAVKKAEARNIANINYAHSTIFDERYKRGSFDVILVFYVLHLLEDEQKVIKRINELLKPEGLIISATPCMGEMIFLRNFLFLAGRVGFVPNIRSFMMYNLVNAIKEGNFSIVETERLKKSSQEYFIVARKI